MRQFFFLVPALIAAGCSGNPPDNDNAAGQAASAQQERFTIRAGPVANAQLTALAGTFQVLKTGSPSGIPSTGMGGACLAFPAADVNFTEVAEKQCQNNRDCSTPTRAGYCDVETRSCWAKPVGEGGAAVCNKAKIWPVNELNGVPDEPIDVARLRLKAGAKVRVVACLNKTGATSTGCRSADGPDRIQVMGPVATLR